MSDWLSTLIAIAFLGFFVVLCLLRPILAATITPKDDLTRIRANLEGPAGEAGPSMQVVDIQRDGIRMTGSRYAQPARAYRVTLRRADGSTQQRTIQIKASLFGQGDLSVDHPAPTPSASMVQRGSWFIVLRIAVVVVVGGLAWTTLLVVSAAPFIGEAKNQIGYVLGRNDIHIVELYSAGQMCGVYTAGADAQPMRFLIDAGKVWTGPVLPGGPRLNPPYGSADPYDQWSNCVNYSKGGGRGDEGFALWILNRFS
jgi:hypothetical protein